MFIFKMTLTISIYIQTGSYFGEKSLEKNKEEIMESLIAGIVCKLYDDLQDNPLLKPYRNKTLMEALKIMHTMFFTIASLKDSMVYYLVSSTIVLPNLLSNPEAYSNPYERSVLLVCPLLFFFMKRPTPITKIELIFIFGFISTNVCETYYGKEEYSYAKCLTRLYFCFLSIVFYLFSTSLKPVIAYTLGYFVVSFIVQLYSVTISNKRRKKLNKWLESWLVKSKADRKTVH
jgi:hypothetical protein